MNPKSNQPFYIGYIEKMPSVLKVFLRPWLIVLFVSVLLIAILIISQQKGFVSSTFELGTLTEVEGILIKSPIPMLRIVAEENKEIVQHIVLVGFGKHGAEGTIQTWENQTGEELEGKKVKIRGTLIYFDGKTVMELTEGPRALDIVYGDRRVKGEEPKAGKEVALLGEIIDPKCYFGVMKPGHGKPHRSCAARCIAGGIPPVVRVPDAKGAMKYFLLLGEANQPLNKNVLPYVGQEVKIVGREERLADWDILRIADIAAIQKNIAAR